MLQIGRRLATERITLFGRVVRLFFASFGPASLSSLDREKFIQHFSIMGLRALPLITFGSIFVSLALTTQVVLEARRFNAQDLTGAGIAVGLLRELAPLTVGLAWTGRTAAYLAEVAFAQNLRSEAQYEVSFLAPAYLAAIAAALPLAAYGLVLGFGAASLFAPILGVSSTADFLEAARQAIRDKDVAVYLLKLVVINPTIVVFAASLVALNEHKTHASVTASAITYACILVFLGNLVCTWAWYLP